MTLPLENTVALVTGASRGIGRGVALELARQGAHVIALARTQGALEALDDDIRALGKEATLVPCDLKDFDALDRLGLAIHERWGRLDCLVANAGLLGPVTPLSHIEPAVWDDVIAINVTANYRLIRSLDVLLRTSPSARAIFLTSGAGHRANPPPYRGLYASSKAALEAIVRSYAAEMASTKNVKVMAVSPGHVRTSMRATLMPGEDPRTLPTPEDIAPMIVSICDKDWPHNGAIYDLGEKRIKHFREPE